MPWPWTIASACLNLSTGQIVQYPLAGAYRENAFVIDAMTMVWRVWKLFNTPMSKMVGDQVVTMWTGSDIDFYDWLNSNAWND